MRESKLKNSLKIKLIMKTKAKENLLQLRNKKVARFHLEINKKLMLIIVKRIRE